MKRGPTMFLKIVLMLLGALVLAICALWIPKAFADVSGFDSSVQPFVRIMLAAMFVAAFPFYYALFHALRVLKCIDTDTVFTQTAMSSMKAIKYAAAGIGILYLAILPVVFVVADSDDAPGLILFGMMLSFAGFVVATLAAMFQGLLKSAIAFKFEQDLTV